GRHRRVHQVAAQREPRADPRSRPAVRRQVGSDAGGRHRQPRSAHRRKAVSAEPAAATPAEPKNYLNCETSFKSWLLTRDHKRIGLMFLASVTVALFLGGLFAMLIRIELLTPDETIMSAQTYNRMFTLHGVVMIFLFMIPAIPSGFGNFVLPMMIGAEDV